MNCNFEKYGIEIPFRKTSGKIKTFCPKCHDTRTNKRDKSLSVNLDSGLFKCHYCDFSSSASEHKNEYRTKREYSKPKFRNNTELSDKLVQWFDARGIRQETLKKMQITEGLEFMPQVEKQMNTVQFNYFLNGELVNVKYRTGDKLFKLVSNAELILWNIDAIKDEAECVITEGEIDALSYIQAGYNATVSVPNGANANLDYLDDYIDDYFDNKEVIYIAVDTDTKGLLLRDELVRRFGSERCKIVTYYDGCKDANEHLIKLGTHSLLETLKNAKDIKVEGIFGVTDFEDALDSLYNIGLQRGVTIGHDNFDKAISFETKRVMIVTGIPGHGKSEFVDEIVERLNIRYGWRCAYFSPENFPLQIHASKLISKITGKKFQKDCLNLSEYRQAKEYVEKNFFFISPDEDYSMDSVLDKAKYLVKKRGVRILVIDPYNKLEHQITGSISETNYISKQLDLLHIFAQKYDCMVVLVAHPRKMNKSNTSDFDVPTLYDINGSANFYNKADFGLTVYRDRKKELVEVHIQKVKFKHLGEGGINYFHYNFNNGRFVPYNEFSTNINWDNGSHIKNLEEQLQIPADDFFTASAETPPF